MSLHRKGPLAIAVGGLLFALLPGATAGATPKAALPSDFNGDGYADLAIGVPFEDVGPYRIAGEAGGVNVVYGSPKGLTATGNQFWSQDSPGILEASEFGDTLGASLASGDFDRDGYADLAVGAPLEGNGAGVVNVLYGSPGGLTAVRNQLWAASGLGGVSSMYEEFGGSLASGDFDGDGAWDLAVASPGRTVEGVGMAGAVDVIFGSPSGLSMSRRTTLTQATSGVPGDVLAGQYFGSALAAGDLDGDGDADLAIGVTAAAVGGIFHAGSVIVLYGDPDSLDGFGSQLWSQDSPGIPGTAEAGDEFGGVIEIGDFDRDGTGDLAIGIPAEGVGRTTNAGAVNVIYGSPAGLVADGAQLWHQGSPGVPGASESNDAFGASLAAGDFDGDGAADLAIGAPPEALGAKMGAGAVTVLRGGSHGLTAGGSRFLTQDTPGVPGTAEWGDAFGWSLASADYGRTGNADLAIGVCGENIGRVQGAGVVNVLYGSTSGPSGTKAQGWSQDWGLLGVAERGDDFGSSLTP
jgi:hypothetical protein